MKVIVQGIATEYEDRGTGPTLLFLHGWQDNLHTFDGICAAFENQARIVRLDLPGFGGTETPAKPWDLDNYINFVADFVKKIGLQTDVLIGHSFGGRIVIKGQATGILSAKKIILIAAAGVSRRPTWKNLFLRYLAKAGRLLTSIPPLSFWQKSLRKKLYQKLGSDYFLAGRLKETLVKVVAEDLSSITPKVNIPTLLIWGENDNATPLADGKLLAKLIPNSNLEIINEAGHMVHQEQTAQVVTLIKRFL